MNKAEISFKATALSRLSTIKLEEKLRDKLSSLGIVINITELKIKDKGTLHTQERCI